MQYDTDTFLLHELASDGPPLPPQGGGEDGQGGGLDIGGGGGGYNREHLTQAQNQLALSCVVIGELACLGVKLSCFAI